MSDHAHVARNGALMQIKGGLRRKAKADAVKSYVGAKALK